MGGSKGNEAIFYLRPCSKGWLAMEEGHRMVACAVEARSRRVVSNNKFSKQWAEVAIAEWQ